MAAAGFGPGQQFVDQHGQSGDDEASLEDERRIVRQQTGNDHFAQALGCHGGADGGGGTENTPGGGDTNQGAGGETNKDNGGTSQGGGGTSQGTGGGTDGGDDNVSL